MSVAKGLLRAGKLGSLTFDVSLLFGLFLDALERVSKKEGVAVSGLYGWNEGFLQA